MTNWARKGRLFRSSPCILRRLQCNERTARENKMKLWINPQVQHFLQDKGNRLWGNPQVHQFFQEKSSRLMAWYEKVTGMDEVRMMQNRVLEAQDRFAKAQEARRDASSKLSEIKQKLREIQWELSDTHRGSDKYIQLMMKERNIIQEELVLANQFSELERLERDSFALLSTTVRDSHEKERAQANKTKYWSIIGSIVGTLIGVIGSSINNDLKIKQLRSLVKEAIESRPGTLTIDEKSLARISELLDSREQPRNDQSSADKIASTTIAALKENLLKIETEEFSTRDSTPRIKYPWSTDPRQSNVGILAGVTAVAGIIVAIVMFSFRS